MHQTLDFIFVLLIGLMVILFMFNLCEGYVAENYPSAWKHKTWRYMSRINKRLLGESFVGNSNMVHKPVHSYYKTYSAKQFGKDSIVVGLHYTNWCGYCKRMKPIWEKLKKEFNTPEYSGITMIENDEEKAPTPGIDHYPTIYKYRGGKMREYKGLADYDQLRTFILTPMTVETYGTGW